MILSLGTSTHCRLCFEASALFKPSFCKASGVGDRTFCEKYGKLYLRRFLLEHWNRFMKQRLHWTLPKLGTTEKGQRWSDLIPIMTWQLW